MPGIELQQDGARIDAAVLARAFGISADDLRQGMRDGTITSRFERGAGKDAGTVRLIFFSSSRRIRITADESGRILTCGAVDFAGSSGPGSRRPARITGRLEAGVIRDRRPISRRFSTWRCREPSLPATPSRSASTRRAGHPCC